MIDWEITAKLILAFVGIVSVAKVVAEILAGKKANLREEYKFARDFINDIEEKEVDSKSLHPFLIGKGYQAIAGTAVIRSSEIEYMLSLEDPVQCLRDYIFARKIFENLNVKGDFKLIYKNRYRKRFARITVKSWYFVLYVVFASLAISPWIIAHYASLTVTETLMSMLLSLPIFGLYSFWSLRAGYRIKTAEELFNRQKKHTQRIVIV